MCEEQIQAFLSGESFCAYNFFGAHQWDDEWVFRVYAPGAASVELIGEFNAWVGQPMTRLEPYGIYEVKVLGVMEGQMYKYRIYEPSGLVRDKADPFAFCSELRPQTASKTALIQQYAFSDEAFLKRRNNQYGSPMSIYEVHMGSWRRKEDGTWFTYREIADPLIAYVKENNYTHIELLPLAEHPLDASWGYLVSGYFSVTARYGTPEDFMCFVDNCHRQGIGVIMDFVPVHFVHNDYALMEFDGTPLYEYEHDSVGISEWSSNNFNFYRAEVQSFLKSAAHFWLDIYHCDGLRMDAISNALYWQGDPQRGVNIGAVNFLRSLNQGLEERKPGVILIAEDSSNFPKVTARVEYGGLGYHYKWDLGWMNDTLHYFSLPLEQRPSQHHLLTFSLDYFYNELYLLAFSHDEVVHGKGSILNKMWGEYDQRFAQCRALYLYFFTHPGKKLNFMGNEFAHFDEWDADKSLFWRLLDYPAHENFSRMIRDLNAFYCNEPVFYNREYSSDNFQWIDPDDRINGTYVYIRKHGNRRYVIALNTGGRAWSAFPLELPESWGLDEIFSTDQPYYGGSDMTNTVPMIAQSISGRRQPYFCSIRLPAFGGSIFRILE